MRRLHDKVILLTGVKFNKITLLRLRKKLEALDAKLTREQDKHQETRAQGSSISDYHRGLFIVEP